jgi:hypothetical protein
MDFTVEDWKDLESEWDQRDLFWDVTLNHYQDMFSFSKCHPTRGSKSLPCFVPCHPQGEIRSCRQQGGPASDGLNPKQLCRSIIIDCCTKFIFRVRFQSLLCTVCST